MSSWETSARLLRLNDYIVKNAIFSVLEQTEDIIHELMNQVSADLSL